MTTAANRNSFLAAAPAGAVLVRTASLVKT
jgi:hypothetical protein